MRSGVVKYSSEFKTTLSEPVDEQQWRTLGEGAGYRIVGPVVRLQAGRSIAQKKISSPADPGLRLARSVGEPMRARPPANVASERPDPLGLRKALELARPGMERLSRIELDGDRRAQ